MRIVSWNVQWGRGADGRVDLVRTIDALTDCGSADVICLQEVSRNFRGLPGGNGEDELVVFTAAFPDHRPVYAAALDLPDGDGGRACFGNLLMSRLPVGQVFRHLLPCPADPGQPAMQRVCVEAVIEARRGPLRVLTTHLEYYSALQRRAQVEALRALHAEAVGHSRSKASGEESNPAFAAYPRPAAAVICGDFNCEPDSAEYRRMLEPIAEDVPAWRDAWRVAHGDAPHAPSVGLHGAEWPDRPYCCDFAFVSADLAPRVRSIAIEAETDASDHQPLVLELDD